MDDTALVAAMASRDPAGLDGAYRRYADRLYAYVRSLTGDSHAAADVVHDTFVLASEHIAQLRDPSRLPQWLYAIARREGLRQIRRQARHAPLEVAQEVGAEPTDVTAALHSAQVAEVVRAAMGGLSPADREVAELAVRHQLGAAEIAAVLDVPLNHAHARLSRAREQLAICLGALLVARGAHAGECRELTKLLRGWDGRLTPLLRKRLHRHIETCAQCSGVQRERLNPAALLSSYAALPFLAAPTRPDRPIPPAPQWHPDTGFPVQPDQPAQPRLGRRTLAVAAAALALLLIVAAAVYGATLGTPTPAGPPETAAVGAGPSEPPLAVVPTTTPPATAAPATTKPTTVAPQPPPPPPPPAALAFTTTMTATCASPNVKLKVTATANATLASATLTVQGLIGTRAMTVTGKTAQITVTGAVSTSIIIWHVDIKAADGWTLKGPNRSTAHPCYG